MEKNRIEQDEIMYPCGRMVVLGPLDSGCQFPAKAMDLNNIDSDVDLTNNERA